MVIDTSALLAILQGEPERRKVLGEPLLFKGDDFGHTDLAGPDPDRT